jgi:YD repeat-containing protein
MEDRGVFFRCAPYGTCWEPTADSNARGDGQTAPPSAVGQGPEFQPRLSPSSVSIYAGDPVNTKISTIALAGFAEPVGFTVELPQGLTCVAVCSGQLLPGEPFVLRLGSAPNLPIGSYEVPVTFSSGPLTHVAVLKIYVGLEADADFVPVDFDVDAGPVFPCGPGGYPPHLPVRLPRGLGRYGGAPGYAWAVCHTGAWIYRRHMYVWVIDKRGHHPHPGPPHPPRHPHPPIRWIKCRHKDVWVPRHPDDVEGKLPLNWKHVAFHPVDKKDSAEETVKVEAKDIVEPLAETPKEYSDLPLSGLVMAEPPVLHAYATRDRLAGNKLAGGTDLRFSRESHGFLLAREVKEGGKTRVVTESFEEHRVSSRVAGSGAGARSGGAMRTGGSSHAGSGGSHAASGGSHAAASHASSGGSHAGSGGSHASSPPPAHH